MSHCSKFAGWRSPHYLDAYDTTTQTISAAGEAFAWKYNTVNYSRGISIINGSKITVSRDGVYNIQFSVQLKTTTASDTEVFVWPRVNGVNVPNSNTEYDVAGSAKAQTLILNYMLRLNKDDYVQIMWSDSTTTTLAASLSSTSPDKPAIPSIILTVWQID